MNIPVPWKIRLRSGGTNPHDHWWNRKKFHDDPGAGKHADVMHEEDLDHLGALHRSHRH